MKKHIKYLIFLFLISVVHPFDIEKIPDCPQKILLENMIILYNGEVPLHLKEYIIKKWGYKVFEEKRISKGDSLTYFN